MADVRSPDPAMGQKQRVPVASLIQSPTSPFFLSPNDDQQERAQARAARAAAIRRKSIAVNALPQRDDPDPCLGKQQILELFNNCIKLASENVTTRLFFLLLFLPCKIFSSVSLCFLYKICFGDLNWVEVWCFFILFYFLGKLWLNC